MVQTLAVEHSLLTSLILNKKEPAVDFRTPIVKEEAGRNNTRLLQA
jgi:hypothetical protein